MTKNSSFVVTVFLKKKIGNFIRKIGKYAPSGNRTHVSLYKHTLHIWYYSVDLSLMSKSKRTPVV